MGAVLLVIKRCQARNALSIGGQGRYGQRDVRSQV